MPGPIEEKPLGAKKLYHLAQVVTDACATQMTGSAKKFCVIVSKGGAKGGRDNNLERHSRGRGLCNKAARTLWRLLSYITTAMPSLKLFKTAHKLKKHS